MWNVVCREPHIRYTTYHIQSIYEPIGVIRTFLAVDFSILSLSSSAKILCLLCFVSSVEGKSGRRHSDNFCSFIGFDAFISGAVFGRCW